MAILKNTTVSGSLRATDTLAAQTAQFKILNAPTTSNGTTYGPGSNGNFLKSNGTSIYWVNLAAADIPTISITDKTSGTLTVARGGTGATTAAGARTNLGLGTMATETAADYLKLSGGTMTGPLQWTSSALPEKTNPNYFLVIDAFADGGKTYWVGKDNAKAALLNTNATHNNTFLRKDGTWQIPVDTKNTAGSTNSTSQLYLIGATTQAANPTTNSYQYTYVKDSGLLSSVKLGLNASGTEKVHMEWNDTDQTIDFVFA